MAIISIPLGYKVVDQQATADSGTPIDNRQVFGSETIRDDYTPNFFYEGLLSYTVGLPYHTSGVTANSGYYSRYNDSGTFSWAGLDADTLDNKHAYGTMDSTSNAETDPEDSDNIVDHVNYLYTLTDALSGSRQWLDSVSTYANIITTYPSPTTGDSVLVRTTNTIWTYNGSTWVETGSNSPSLSATVDGIVNHTWWSDLNDFVINTNKYTNQNAFSNLTIRQGGSFVGDINALSTASSFTLNAGPGITLTSTGSQVNIRTNGSSSISANNFEVIYQNGSGVVTGARTLKYTGGRLIFGEDLGGLMNNVDSSIIIGRDAMLSSLDGIIYNEAPAGDQNIAIGNAAGYSMGFSNSGNDWGVNNLLLGHTAGYNIPFGTDNRFIVSMGTYDASPIAGGTNFNELRLLDGSFPATSSGSSYGSLKVRGIVYFKENDTSINRLIKSGGDYDMVFSSPESGIVYLSDLIAGTVSGLQSSINGLSDDDGVVSLGGNLTKNTTISGDYDITLEVFDFTVTSTGSVYFDTSINPISYSGEAVMSAPNNIVHKKYVDDLFDTITPAHDEVTLGTSNGLSLIGQELSLELADDLTTGALSSSDWVEFNEKEPAITSGLTTQYYRGDKSWQILNTDIVPQGVNNRYFSEPLVRDTLLTGLNVLQSGVIMATDSVLEAFGKLQNQISNFSGSGTSISLADPTNGLFLFNGILGIDQASSSTTGSLSNHDWSMFNNKEDSIIPGFSFQYYRGDKTWASLTTAAVEETSGALYYNNTRFDSRFEYWSGISGGFAPLSSTLKIPTIYLPSYMDTIVEVANYAALPLTGESGTIYITMDDNKTFRWGTTVYVEVSSSPVTLVNGYDGVVSLDTDDIDEGTTNLYFGEALVLATTITGLDEEATGDVYNGDNILEAISKLNNKVAGSTLQNGILEYTNNTFMPYSEEYEDTFYTGNEYLNYGGDFSADSIQTKEEFRIGDTWKFIVDPTDTAKLLLQYYNGSTWITVTTFDATNIA